MSRTVRLGKEYETWLDTLNKDNIGGCYDKEAEGCEGRGI